MITKCLLFECNSYNPVADPDIKVINGGSGEGALVEWGQLSWEASLVIQYATGWQEEENGKTLVRDKCDRAIILVSFVMIFH